MKIARVFTANASGVLAVSVLRQFLVFPAILSSSSLADEFAWSVLLLDIITGSIGAWLGDYYYKIQSNNRGEFCRRYFWLFFVFVLPPLGVIAGFLSGGSGFYFFSIFFLAVVFCFFGSINMLAVKFQIEDGKSVVMLTISLCRIAAWLIFLSLYSFAESSQMFVSILIACFIFGEVFGSYILKSYRLVRRAKFLGFAKKELSQSLTFVFSSILLLVLQRVELLSLQAFGADDFAQMFVTIAFINLVIMPINLFSGLPMAAMLSLVGEDSGVLSHHVVRFVGGLSVAILVLSFFSPYLVLLLYRALYPDLQMILDFNDIRLLVVFGALFLVCARIILKVASEQFSALICAGAVIGVCGILSVVDMSGAEVVVYGATFKGLVFLCCMLFLLFRKDQWVK